MKQNRLIIIGATLLIIAVVLFMFYDFFMNNSTPEKNVYEYNLEEFNKVDPALVKYSEVLRISPNITQLKAVNIDEYDNIYVTGKDKILIFDSSGDFKKEIITGTDALSIAVDNNNNIWIGTHNHIETWDLTGTMKDRWGINSKAIITSIVVYESSVLVADAGNKIVYHYDLDGNMINEIGRKDSLAGIQGFVIPSPYFDLAIGRDGELWVVNSGRHQLESYNLDGRLISSWKKTSMGLDGFSGCCNPSNIAVLPNGSFVTSEKGIVRVKIHNPSGDFESVVATPDQFEKGTRGLDIAVDSKGRILVLDPKKGKIRIFSEKDK